MPPTPKVTNHAKNWTGTPAAPVQDSLRVVRGSPSGAGGIGGLLGRSHGYSAGNWSTHNFYHADGNGNVTYLVNSSQTKAAAYRYDPYGNTISSSGSLAAANTYRFSSKELHVNSGLYYYGFRWYDPNAQSWLNRDPIGEWGGINLFGFCQNSSVGQFDKLGLSSEKKSKTSPPVFDPTFWNDPCRKEQNNCYNYALDRPSDNFRNQFSQPGAGNQLGMGDPTSCENLMMRIIELDGGKRPEADGNCKPGFHKACVWYEKSRPDYHFYRQDADGSWSHKPGYGNACPVSDPNSYRYKERDYEKCGDVCLKDQPTR